MLEELKAAIPEDILLTLKTANMVSQRQGCRVDFLHYTHPKFSFSPDWRTWQLLWKWKLLETESHKHPAEMTDRFYEQAIKNAKHQRKKSHAQMVAHQLLRKEGGKQPFY